MLPAAISCSSGFHKCVRFLSIRVTAALPRLPSLSPSRVTSSRPPAPPPTTTIWCNASFPASAGRRSSAHAAEGLLDCVIVISRASARDAGRGRRWRRGRPRRASIDPMPDRQDQDPRQATRPGSLLALYRRKRPQAPTPRSPRGPPAAGLADTIAVPRAGKKAYKACAVATRASHWRQGLAKTRGRENPVAWQRVRARAPQVHLARLQFAARKHHTNG